MEHRWNVRRAVRARAIVYHPHYGACVGNVRDASISGAFIKLLHGECPPNSPVTLLLPVESANRTRLLQLPAMVVRSEGDGIAVMFLDHDEETAHVLHRWIDPSSVAPQTGTADVPGFTQTLSGRRLPNESIARQILINSF